MHHRPAQTLTGTIWQKPYLSFLSRQVALVGNSLEELEMILITVAKNEIHNEAILPSNWSTHLDGFTTHSTIHHDSRMALAAGPCQPGGRFAR